MTERALQLGFDRVGVCLPSPSRQSAVAYRRWVNAGMAAEMGYMARPNRVSRALDPALTLAGVRSAIVVAAGYHTALASADRQMISDPARGRIASYAWGADYHDLLGSRLSALSEWLAEEVTMAESRFYVDTGPLLERDAARRAGLGFFGRNAMLIHPRAGSWTFLGVLLTTAELVDEGLPPSDGTCGECARCIEACPTGAILSDGVVDARLCLSYLTIENRGPIPRELRAAVGNRIFGCDVCNAVCPYNRRFAAATGERRFAPRDGQVAPRLLELIELDEESFRERFAGTAISRAKRRGLVRNVCVALGNWASPEAQAPLARALRDQEPLVRGHAAWALSRIGGRAARREISGALVREADQTVRAELVAALDDLGAGA